MAWVPKSKICQGGQLKNLKPWVKSPIFKLDSNFSFKVLKFARKLY